LKTGLEEEIAVTESWEVPEFWQLNERLPDGGFLYVELFDFQIQRRPRDSEFGSRSTWPSNFSVAFC
jgi:hypothetical protein